MSKMKELDIENQEAALDTADDLVVDIETGELQNAPDADSSKWPEGFEAFDLSYEEHKAWDWDANPTMLGKVTSVKTVMLKRKGKDTEVLMMVVGVDDTEYAIWETAALKPLMEKTYAGQHVAIRFLGMEKRPGGRRMRRFEARTRG